MRPALSCLPCLFLLLSVSAMAAELDNAAVRVDLSYGFSLDRESSMAGLFELVPELDFSVGEKSFLVTSARVRLDSENELEPGRPNLDSYASGSRPLILGNSGTAEVRDFYLERRGATSLLRLGKQQIVWGRLDGITVLDVINPQEFREFILDDFGDSRIGLWSAYLDITRNAWRTELALVADATHHAIPGKGAWFELTAPRYRFGAAADNSSLPVTIDEPGHAAADGAAGLRLSRRLGRLDVAAVAYTGRDHEPLGRVVERDGQAMLERYSERRELFGFSAERGFGRVVFRGEYAFQPRRSFNTRNAESLEVIRLDQHRAAVGFDIDGPVGMFINAQYLVDIVRSAPEELVRPGRDGIATVFLRRTFDYDRLAFEFRWYHSVRDSDDIFSFSVDYFVGPNTAITAGAETFSGAPDGLFGQFDGQGRVTLTLGFTF